ncbi:MAG: DUF4159 domain-containing protein [Hyphomicrobiales bacterium]
MFGTALSFASPAILGALILLPVIWWLLRLTPPRPQRQDFPPTRLLAELTKKEDTPHKSPWWLTAIRLCLAALAIIALAGPFWQPNPVATSSDKPLLLVVDNGWTTARDWPKRAKAARNIVQNAIRLQKPVALVMTTEPENAEVRLIEPEKALESLTAQAPAPYPEDRATTATRLKSATSALGDVDVIWLASPLKTQGDDVLASVLSQIGDVAIRFEPSSRFAITHAGNGASALNITIKRSALTTRPATLRALDKDNLSLADVPVFFKDSALETHADIELPIELRNQITRLNLIGEDGNTIESIGATYLIDDRSRRRSIGLVSGVTNDQAQQPLLSPLYYIRRALEPFTDIRDSGTPNLTEAIPELLQSGVSMIVLADVGTIPVDQTDRLRKFMSKGGTIVRFAGPRLAASEDKLTPVRLRAGDRNLGGSLTWEEPQKLARFSETGPFAGMNLPDDIEVTRQVLAEPDFDLLKKTWAELEDGTPLVTAEQVGEGWLVLFHVTADATWSNLPISGAFVDMLVKLTAFSSVPASAIADERTNQTQTFPPFQTLNAYGHLTAPIETAKPIELSKLRDVTATRTTPPGFYGKSESLIAVNLIKKDTKLEMLEPQSLISTAAISSIQEEGTKDLRPAFFTIALLLLLLDSFIVAAMAGLFSRGILQRMRPLASTLLLGSFFLITQNAIETHAQQVNDDISFDATLTTRLAYVVTGDDAIDEISQAGLFGLTNFLGLRTALEPGPPIGVDISKDELAFFSLLYWPIDARAEVPDTNTMARVDAFMKQGGTVLFDTRDQLDVGITSVTPANAKLRQIVANLDIPPLEPVPSNHVLTRAFYLLQEFPGRWQGSPLWVEATQNGDTEDQGSRSQADGVSSIIITANDFAGAWATDENAQPLLPTLPNNPNQRIYAFRVGVNIVMYTLTGNYKADQVHIPALLERLGQ